jgi:hypothetical protein
MNQSVTPFFDLELDSMKGSILAFHWCLEIYSILAEDLPCHVHRLLSRGPLGCLLCVQNVKIKLPYDT